MQKCKQAEIDWANKYQSVYQEMEKTIKERVSQQSYAALGYTTNLDLICDFKIDLLNSLLEKHTPSAMLLNMKKAAIIKSIGDLLETLVYYCSHGIGGEVDIENTETVRECFQWKPGIGGTGAQAAMAQAAVGCPSVVHLTDDSKEVCHLLNSSYIYTVDNKGGLIHTDRISQSQEQEMHFIVQYKKGDQICLGGQKITIPASNRVILTKITVNETVPFSEPYFKYIEDNAISISSNVLSSFNALLDESILKEHLSYVAAHIEKYKKNNPFGIAFFEDAHYHDDRIRKLCLETIYSQVDIVSLNEEELKTTLDANGFPVIIDNITSCVQGAIQIRKWFGVKIGVIVHTKDYSMYVGDRLKADMEKGLIYGNLMAAAKAAYGWYGGMEQLEEVLKLPQSTKGMENYADVAAGSYVYQTILVPTKYIDKPRYTIGLGDSFVAGVQICFS